MYSMDHVDNNLIWASANVELSFEKLFSIIWFLIFDCLYNKRLFRLA